MAKQIAPKALLQRMRRERKERQRAIGSALGAQARFDLKQAKTLGRQAARLLGGKESPKEFDALLAKHLRDTKRFEAQQKRRLKPRVDAMRREMERQTKLARARD